MLEKGTEIEQINEKTYTYQEALCESMEYFNGDELPASIFVKKYALKNNKDELVEKTPTDMHWRIAKEFARIEKDKFKNPLSAEDIFKYLDKFSQIIPQGSPMFGIGNKYQKISLSNCFLIPSAVDSYSGIIFTDEQIVQISKRRGGVGHDISNLRPSGTPTKNAAKTSSGAISFMSRFSNSGREVGQNGRRGAQMISCSIHHPESVIPWDNEVDGDPYDVNVKYEGDMGNVIEIDMSSKYYNPKKIDFATCKYDRNKVTGANISLKLTDEFMKAVKEEKTFEQRWPIDSKNPKIRKDVSAKDVWDKIIHSSWQTAEPGVLFWDNIIRESPADCYFSDGFTSVGTNPCGEIPLSPYDSCRLMALNSFGFVKNPFESNSYFDYEQFYEAAKINQRLMDDLVDLEAESIKGILNKIENDPEEQDIKNREKALWQNILDACLKGRRTGTGVTAIGDTLAAIGVGYGTKEGVETIEKIYRTLKFGAYRSSVDMAKEIGTFKVFDYEKEKNNPFINRIENEEIDFGNGRKISGKKIWEDNKKYGRRNIALLTTAPAGTVSILCKLIDSFGTSSGIEPEYTVEPYIRKVKGNPEDKNFRTDEIDQSGDHFMKFKIFCPAVKDWMKVTGKDDVKDSPWWGHCAEQLDWSIRVDAQAAAQKNVDHSISSTINLPSDVSVEKVSEIYMKAYESGCKGITVYRDGCRTGILVKDGPKAAINEETHITKTSSPKRPKDLPCDVYHLSFKFQRYYVAVGILNGDPYEVFTGINADKEGDIVIPKRVIEGKISKKSRGNYYLNTLSPSGEEESYHLTNGHVSDLADALTRNISMSLRHGIDISYIVHQLEKTKGDLQSFSKVLARTLKKYITNGTLVSGESCPDCGNSSLVRSDGCVACKSCGWSKCA